MSDQMCQNCRHFSPHAVNGQTMGDCRRHPPTVFMVVGSQGPSVLARPGRPQMVNIDVKFPSAFPMVQEMHWCGEFERQVEGAGKEAPKKVLGLVKS